MINFTVWDHDLHPYLWLLILLIIACNKNDPTCWECYTSSINNVTFFCEDPEKIETGERENIQIVCDEGARDQYLMDHSPVTTYIEKECSGEIFFPIITVSPICTMVK